MTHFLLCFFLFKCLLTCSCFGLKGSRGTTGPAENKRVADGDRRATAASAPPRGVRKQKAAPVELTSTLLTGHP